MFHRLSALILLASLALGCGLSPAVKQAWIARHGDVLTDNHLPQARSALAPLCPTSKPLTVQVLASDTPCAYAWPDGSLFVTRALVDLLTPEELTAALAHELGHLVDAPAPAASLRGVDPYPPDLEARADAVGVGLLLRAGVPDPRATMISMLSKIRQCRSLTDHNRRALTRRINRLSQG